MLAFSIPLTSVQNGQCWESGLPNSPVFDINYHQPTQKLVAGTHGRSLFEIDLSGLTDIDQNLDAVVNNFTLYQNYPNPFNPSTTITFTIAQKEFTTMKIYDVVGNEVAVLLNEEKPAGSHTLEFNASKLVSGTYFYKLQAGNNISDSKNDSLESSPLKRLRLRSLFFSICFFPIITLILA